MHKSHLDKIERKFITPLSNPNNRRLHMSERTEKFDASLFNDFISSISQEDFLYYNNTSILKERLAKENGVEAGNIFLGSGSDFVLNTIFNCFVEKDTFVVMPEAHFPMYDVYLKQNQGKKIEMKYELVDDKLKLNTDFYVGNQISLIIVGNPNSPIGDILSLGEITKLTDHGVPLVIDQAYGEFGKTEIPLELLEQNVIMTNTFSKAWGAAGCRVGYAIAKKEIIQVLEKLRQMFEITGLSQKFILFLLDNKHLLADYTAKIIAEREKINTKIKHVQFGNWVHLPEKYFHLSDKWEVKNGVSLPVIGGNYMRVAIFEGLNELL